MRPSPSPRPGKNLLHVPDAQRGKDIQNVLAGQFLALAGRSGVLLAGRSGGAPPVGHVFFASPHDIIHGIFFPFGVVNNLIPCPHFRLFGGDCVEEIFGK